MRYVPCEYCGRPTAVSKAGKMRGHSRIEYRGTMTLTIHCRGSNSYVDLEEPSTGPTGGSGQAKAE